MTEKIGRHELKRLTKEKIANSFIEKGLTTVERSAGVITYLAVKFDENSPYNACSIYGDRTKCASIWVKDNVLKELISNGDISEGDGREIKDVSFFKRGADWSIQIEDFNDAMIDTVVEQVIAQETEQHEAWSSRQEALEEKKRRMKAKEEEMNAKRRDPFN